MAELPPNANNMYYPPPPPEPAPSDFTKPPPPPQANAAAAPYAPPGQPQIVYAQQGPQVVYVQQQPGMAYPPGSTVVVVQSPPTPGAEDDQCCNNVDNGNIRACGTVCDPGVQNLLSWLFCCLGFFVPITMLCIVGTTCICRGRTTLSKLGGAFSLVVLVVTVVWLCVVIALDASSASSTYAPLVQ